MKSVFVYFMVVLWVSGCNKDDLPSLDIKEYPSRINDFSLWQLEPFYGESQMGYIIRGDDKKIILIDGGVLKAAPIVNNYILQLGGVVDTWIITHPHPDHAGVLNALLNDQSVRINRVVQSTLDLETIAKFEPGSLAFVTAYYHTLAASGVPVVEAERGDRMNISQGVDLEVLGAGNDAILVNMVNNSSLAFKISSKSKSLLILGDLGVEGGNELMKTVPLPKLKADYVQMAHHGQDGVSREFYQAVSPKFALWPTPGWLWDNNEDARGYNTGAWKTLSVRTWMDELKVQMNIVSGLEGTIQID